MKKSKRAIVECYIVFNEMEQPQRRTAAAIDHITNEESGSNECSSQEVQRLESNRSKERER